MTSAHWVLGATVFLLCQTPATPLGISHIRAWLGHKLHGRQSHARHGVEEMAADFRNEEAIHIVYILCGSHREDEFLTSLKSLHLFAVTALQEEPAYYHVHIISNQQWGMNESAMLKPRSNFRMTLHMATPDAPDMFAACAMQDLYIHEMEDFRHIDRVLFLDIDTLWLDDPRGWWSLFEDMRAHGALFGLAEEGGDWYAGHGIPYYGQDRGKSGLNSGAMMMDLASIRQSIFIAERDAILHEYSFKLDLILLGPQDVLDIYGAFHPEHVYEMPCVYNYRHYSGCRSDSGFPVILHGNGHLRDLDLSSQSKMTYEHLYNVFSGHQL